MAKRRAWLTPASQEGPTIVRPLFIPLPFLPMVAGALAELTNSWNWEQSGAVTPTGAAEQMSLMLFNWVDAGVGAMSLFRLTEECAFEFSNDNGETWLPVPGWAEYAATCFTGPQGEQGPIGEAGPQGLQGEQGPIGETGVVGVQLVRVDGDTAPDLTYDENTRILTATLQEQWIRGFHFDAVADWTPVDYIPAHRLAVSTYDDPDARVQIAFIPPYVRSGYLAAGILDDVETLLQPSSDEVACGMATMLMAALSEQWQILLGKLSTTADVSEAVGELIEVFYALGIPIVFQFLADAVTTAFNVGVELLESDLTPQETDAMLCKLYCLTVEYNQFDGAVLALWEDWVKAEYSLIAHPGAWLFANQVKYIDIGFLKRRALIGSLDPLGTCALCDCSEGWCIEYDFTVSDGGWTVQGGYGAWQSGQGWYPTQVGGSGSKQLRIRVNLPAGDYTIQAAYVAYTGLVRSSADGSISILDDGSTLYFTSAPAAGNGDITYNATVSADGWLQLNLATGLSAGAGYITTLRFSADAGENPLGVTNC